MTRWKNGTDLSDLTVINTVCALLGALLFVSPWLLGFSGEPTATWNACVVGFLVVLVTLVGFIEARTWQAYANLVLGLWAMVAPWLLSFWSTVDAMWTQMGVGFVLAVLAALELWVMHQVDTTVRTA